MTAIFSILLNLNNKKGFKHLLYGCSFSIAGIWIRLLNDVNYLQIA